MRLILKLIAAPFIVLLTILVTVLLFLFSVSSFLLTTASIIMALLGVGLFFISYPVGGIIYLGIAFLLSPFGLQAVAGAVITGLNSLNLSLRQFITSWSLRAKLSRSNMDGGLAWPPFSMKGGIFSGNNCLAASPRQRSRKYSRGYSWLSGLWEKSWKDGGREIHIFL